MPDTKITALTAIGANPIIPSTFPIPMVDLTDTSMAASGTTKKVTVNQILGAGGTATLASATITGDLTVDTSTLKVDSTNNQVGIGTSTPGGALEVFKNTNGQNRLFLNNPSTGASAYDAIDFTAGTANNQILSMGSGYSGSFPYLTGALLLRSAQANGIVLNTAGSAAAIQFGINDTLGMTLNSTGLGVGRTPSTYKFEVSGNAQIIQTNFLDVALRISQGPATTGNKSQVIFTDSTGTLSYITGYGSAVGAGLDGMLALGVGGSDRVFISTTGNVGIGVLPSAWGSGYTALQNRQTCWFSTSARDLNLGANVYVDAVGYKYIATAAASNYVQYQGAHSWYTAPSGTAGNAITFTQSMTLDANGILVVGNTAAASVGVTGGWLASPNSGNSYELIGHNSGSASGSVYSYFFYNSSQIGSITQNGTTGVLYNTTSDYRLKESVQPIANGLARVNALKPSIYKWKVDGSNGEGFIAHELAEVVPFAVSGEKDAVNEDGSIKPQGVDLSKVVPILVAAIQELSARVQTLETR